MNSPSVFLASFFLVSSVIAGPKTPPDTSPKIDEPVPLNVITLESSVVFSSGVEFTHKEIGRGSALHNRFESIRRIPIRGQWYFQAGAAYDRFDFGGSANAFVPSTLQTFNVPVGVSYIMYGHVGFLAQIRPGFYFEHEVTRGAFDVPIELGGYIPIVTEKLYGVWGLGVSFLRHYPAIPTLGVVWLINDKLRLEGYLPNPRLLYQVSDSFSIWAGGEVLAGSYKVDRRDRPNDPKVNSLNGTTIDYTEVRAGLGFLYTPAKHWEITAAAGFAVDRTFDYWRANKSYIADPAPYLRVQIGGEF